MSPTTPPLSPAGIARRGRSGSGTARFAVVAGAFVLALTACGGSPSGSSPSGASSGAGSGSATSVATGQQTFPVTVKGAKGPVTIASAPKAVVSLGPSLTEMLFAIGAGGQVKAVDDQSTYPAQAPRTKLSGFQPNAEAVAGYQPDLVVLSNDSFGLVAALTALKIPVLELPAPASVEESLEQQKTLGVATGHADDAARVADTTRRRIDAAIASVPKTAAPLKIYHEIDQTYYSVTSKTFLGGLYARFGLTNIADAAPKAAASGGYPQLSAEYVVSARPDLIVLADGRCCQQSPEIVAKRPAFGTVPAVTNGKVIAVDDDIASRWGPRVADFAETVARVLGGTAPAGSQSPAAS
ncbi:MAG: transporter substrate-binding protein [Actinomycetota bacterium]|nr:transporter substrate-binding protein [Actinomycetota bacterium]